MPDELTSIFISYVRADSPFVDRLEADLHRQCFAPWLDRRGLAGGRQWWRELQGAVDRCQVLLVLLSPDAVASPYVQIEYGWPDLCEIAEGNMLATLEHLVSFLFRRRPDSNSIRNLQGAHFLLTVPASIHLQLDGSSVQLEDYLSRADREALQQAPDRGQVMVSYRFDALTHALHMALPATYDKTLFEQLSYTGETHTANEQQPTKAPSERHNRQHEQVRRDSSDELITMLLEDG
jgi:hypothetical protein